MSSKCANDPLNCEVPTQPPDNGVEEGQWVGVGIAVLVVLLFILWLLRTCTNRVRRQEAIDRLCCRLKDIEANHNGSQGDSRGSQAHICYTPRLPPSYKEAVNGSPRSFGSHMGFINVAADYDDTFYASRARYINALGMKRSRASSISSMTPTLAPIQEDAGELRTSSQSDLASMAQHLPQNETPANHVVQNETPANHVVQNEIPANHVVQNETLANHVVQNEPRANHVAQNEPPANHVVQNETPANHVAQNEPRANHVVQNEPRANHVAQNEPPANLPGKVELLSTRDRNGERKWSLITNEDEDAGDMVDLIRRLSRIDNDMKEAEKENSKAPQTAGN